MNTTTDPIDAHNAKIMADLEESKKAVARYNRNAYLLAGGFAVGFVGRVAYNKLSR